MKNNDFIQISQVTWTKEKILENSRLLDSKLDLNVESVERNLLQKKINIYKDPIQHVYLGCPVDDMLTPYPYLSEAMNLIDLPEGATVVELGCGYARLAFVMTEDFPKLHYIGFEIVSERLEEARRCLTKVGFKGELHCKDLFDPDVNIPQAEAYFIGEYGTSRAIEKSLNDLRLISQSKKIFVVVIGPEVKNRIKSDHPWLAKVNEFDAFTMYSNKGV